MRLQRFGELIDPKLRRNFLHFRLIPGFGMALGELFWLDDLAAACASDGRCSFLFTSAPLNVPGGVRPCTSRENETVSTVPGRPA